MHRMRRSSRRVRAASPLVIALALAACVGDDKATSASVSEGETSSSTGGSMTTTTGDPTITTTTPSTSDGSESDATGAEPGVCGDGVVGPGESCDDGNQVGGDGCEADCALPAGAEWWREVVDGGATDLDEGHDVAVDAAGNIYIVATTVDPFTKSDIYIRKYDPIGTSLWTRTYDGGANQNDLGTAITGDAAGFMVVAGRQTLQGAMSSVLWLSKCDPNGQILWQQTADAATSIAGLAMFSNTHFIAVGSVKEGADTNALVRRYDGEAGEIWTSTHAGADGGPDSAAAVAVNGAGDLFVAGREFTDAASFNAWVARYSPSGEQVWSRSFDGPVAGADWASAVAVSDEGWLVVGGRMDAGPDALGDAWLARLSITGGDFWSTTIGGPAGADDQVNGLAIDGEGEIVAVGRISAGAGTDAWIRKLDRDGVERWTRTIDGPAGADDEFQAVAIDGDDNIASVGTLTITDGFDSDILLVKHAP